MICLWPYNHRSNFPIFVEQFTYIHYMTLAKLIEKFLDGDSRTQAHALDDEYSIITQPTFAVLPSHPYQSPFTVAIYCRRGEGQGRINAQCYNLKAGDFFIILSGQITELTTTSKEFEATYIIMTDTFTESLSIGNTFNLRNTIAQSPLVSLGPRESASLESYISMVNNIISIEEHPHRMEILRLLTRAFFLGLGHFIHKQASSIYGKSRQHEITARFLQLVEHNYREHRDVGYYAQRLHLTTKYLAATIKQSSGRSATEWIERHVTLDAITKLTSTQQSIKEIAYELNFPSASFFGKYFRRVVGLSPTEYRTQHR